jgi:hypothetical protein
MYYVTAYIKGGAIEHETAKPFEKSFPHPYSGVFDFYADFREFRLGWLISGIPSGKQHQIGDH